MANQRHHNKLETKTAMNVSFGNARDAMETEISRVVTNNESFDVTLVE